VLFNVVLFNVVLFNVALFNLRAAFATIDELSINCDPQRMNFATTTTGNFVTHSICSYEQGLSGIDLLFSVGFFRSISFAK
jgi:hypothetical protein